MTSSSPFSRASRALLLLAAGCAVQSQSARAEATALSASTPVSAETMGASSPPTDLGVSDGSTAPVNLAAACKPCARVSDATLATVRGGFDDGHGLQASFGIERSAFINGALVSRQTINIPDLAHISPAQASQLQSLVGGVNLVQNGPGNAALGALPAGATVIQNTLDNQAIKGLTVLNATTNSLQWVKGLNAASTLSDALLAPLTGR